MKIIKLNLTMKVVSQKWHNQIESKMKTIKLNLATKAKQTWIKKMKTVKNTNVCKISRCKNSFGKCQILLHYCMLQLHCKVWMRCLLLEIPFTKSKPIQYQVYLSWASGCYLHHKSFTKRKIPHCSSQTSSKFRHPPNGFHVINSNLVWHDAFTQVLSCTFHQWQTKQ